jgi:hypothetical protein
MDYECGYGTADGEGNVLVFSENSNAMHQSLVTVLSPEGVQVGTYQGIRFQPVGQRSGFIGLNVVSVAYPYVSVLSHTGAELLRTQSTLATDVESAENPTGGLVVRVDDAVTSYDATGHMRWSASVPLKAFTSTALGVDARGHTLLLSDGAEHFGDKTVEGRWIDAEGHVGEPFLALNRPMGWFELVPRVEGGLFLQAQVVDSENRSAWTWLAEFGSLEPASHPAPEWLARRPDTRLHWVHGGRGYAVMPVSGSSSPECRRDIEVVTPSGDSCGTVRFTGADTACNTTDVWMGYDGTVIQSLPGTCDDIGHCTCDWKWWPAYFR